MLCLLSCAALIVLSKYFVPMKSCSGRGSWQIIRGYMHAQLCMTSRLM